MGTSENVIPPQADERALPAEERIAIIRGPRWIGYTRARDALRRLDDLLVHPKIPRMPNLLLVGDTNNGKTVIARRFEVNHPRRLRDDGDGVDIPVLYIQAPPTPDEGRFYSAILEELFAPYRTSDRVEKKQFQLFRILRSVKLGVLIIDEIHHILAGSLTRQRQFLNVIKYLGNELQIPIVGVGTIEAFAALRTDPQLLNRFEPYVLPRWEMNDDFLRLLASYERLLPLKEQSDLTQHDLAMRLLALSDGLIGELSKLLSAAAVLAIEKRTERIDRALIDSLRWTAPSARKALA